MLTALWPYPGLLHHEAGSGLPRSHGQLGCVDHGSGCCRPVASTTVMPTIYGCSTACPSGFLNAVENEKDLVERVRAGRENSYIAGQIIVLRLAQCIREEGK